VAVNRPAPPVFTAASSSSTFSFQVDCPASPIPPAPVTVRCPAFQAILPAPAPPTPFAPALVLAPVPVRAPVRAPVLALGSPPAAPPSPASSYALSYASASPDRDPIPIPPSVSTWGNGHSVFFLPCPSLES